MLVPGAPGLGFSRARIEHGARSFAQQLDGLPEILVEVYAPVAVAATVEPEATRALALYHCVLPSGMLCGNQPMS